MVNQAAINLVKNAVNIVKSVQDSQVQIQNDRAQGKKHGRTTPVTNLKNVNSCDCSLPSRKSFLWTHTDVEALVGVRKFSRAETGMGVTFRP